MNMRTILGLSLCTCMAACGTAFAKDKGNKDGKKHHKRAERFEKMDTNNDGSVSKDEFIAFHKEHKKGGKKDKKNK